MCKITIIDFKIREKLLREFLVLNALQDNSDGFGYFLMNKYTFKTEKDATDILLNYEFPTKDLRGVYHVRKASSQVKNIVEAHSHPHTYNNAVVFHNGTLLFQDWGKDHNEFKKLFTPEDTDSMQYTKIIGSMGDISFENIKKALDCFTGPYVIIHMDKRNPKKLWISRGRDRTLAKLTIKDFSENENGKIIGTVFNTTRFELSWLLFNIMLENPTYGGEIEDVKENQTYTYEFGSFSLEKVGENIQQGHSTIYIPPRGGAVDSDNNIIDKIVDATRVENIFIVDLIKLFELLCDVSIFDIPNKETFKTFLSMVRQMGFLNSNVKIAMFDKILTFISQEEFYADMQYPFFMNSGKEMKRKLAAVKLLKKGDVQ